MAGRADADPILMIAGPTASGKTALAIEEALRVGGEVISADSRQVYRGLDIGTAKPALEERGGVPHHFIDELDPDEPFSAGAFARAAEDRIADVLARGRVPIVAGGSTLYLRALRDGLASIPATDPAVRARLNADLERGGLPALLARLRNVDPETAARVDARNPARVVRALEVHESTGVPLSHFHAHPPAPPRFAYRVVLLDPPRDVLYARIDARVEVMMEAGLMEEVRGLLETGVSPDLAPLRTIGYAEVIAHLGGAYGLGETVSLIQRNTRRYAKRQRTYFQKLFVDLQ